jgi:hypothetical protein
MKSERRHELQDNELAKGLGKLPAFWQAHGTKVLLGVIGLALLYMLINYRTKTAQRELDTAKASLADVRELLDEARFREMQPVSPTDLAQFRTAVATDGSAALSAVINQARSGGHNELLADAMLLRGDLNWSLANLPELAGATTRPQLKLEPPAGTTYLALAEEAYRAVLDQTSATTMQKNQARFGLAAVAENRRAWNDAQAQYQAVLDDSASIEAYRSLATIRIALLDDLKQEFILAKPTTAPAVTPLVTPVTQPATLPTTQPVG